MPVYGCETRPDHGPRPPTEPSPTSRNPTTVCDGAIPSKQAVRLVAARRISPEATYGCGSAPESDRLPLLRWVKLCPHPTTQVARRQSPCTPLPRQAVSRRPPLSSDHDPRADSAPRANSRRRSTRFCAGRLARPSRPRTPHTDRWRQSSGPRSHQAHRG